MTLRDQNDYDASTLFTIREASVEDSCRTGKPMKCGDKVRFEHNSTGKNLHSHKGVAAPLSQRQEVSGYGDDGLGDDGDNW